METQEIINELPKDRRDRIGIAHEVQGEVFRHFCVRYPSGYRRRLKTWHEVGHGLVKEIRSLGNSPIYWDKYFPWVDIEDYRKASRDI